MRLLLVALLIGAAALPAAAKNFINDQAGMFSAGVVEQLNTRIANFNAQTGKEIVVQTVPSVTGGDVQTAAQNAFTQNNVNGVLIFIDQGDRKDWIIGDRAAVQAGWWNAQTSNTIGNDMAAQFKAGDFDGGITSAVNDVFDIYRSHLSALNAGGAPSAPAYAQRSGSLQPAAGSGVHVNVFWIIIVIFIGYFILRSLSRAAMGGRYGGPGGGGPGYGYGPGYYGGFGGGGFFSGLLGGLGGAWLGNELFGGGNMLGGGGNMLGGGAPGAGGPPADAGGWQSDPGQAGMGGGADWGGGGFGGGDMGGGFGGGDMGGGGGGGW